jgi:TonB family protein
MTHGRLSSKLGLAAAALALACALLCPSVAARAQAVDDFERGQQLLAKGDAGGAASALKRAAERRKTDADAWYAYGLALGKINKRKDARKAFERAVTLRPDWATARAGLAYTLVLLNKTRDADREAKRAVALDPKSADAHFVVANVRYLYDDFSGAAAAAEEALALQPDFPAAAHLHGDSLINLYIAQSEHQSLIHPLPPGADEAARRQVFGLRDAVLEPYKARMRQTADRLDALAGTRPDAEAESMRELAVSLRLYGRLGGDNRNVFRMGEVTQKALITYKPEPGFTEEARRNNTAGVVRLRAVLAADGRVRHISIIKGLPDGLTERCIAVARQIKFTPARVNGAPVSQFVVLDYNFNIH